MKKATNDFKSKKINCIIIINLVIITDYYRIEDIIGQGTFGKVKLATHILTGEKVKILFKIGRC